MINPLGVTLPALAEGRWRALRMRWGTCHLIPIFTSRSSFPPSRHTAAAFRPSHTCPKAYTLAPWPGLAQKNIGALPAPHPAVVGPHCRPAAANKQ